MRTFLGSRNVTGFSVLSDMGMRNTVRGRAMLTCGLLFVAIEASAAHPLTRLEKTWESLKQPVLSTTTSDLLGRFDVGRPKRRPARALEQLLEHVEPDSTSERVAVAELALLAARELKASDTRGRAGLLLSAAYYLDRPAMQAARVDSEAGASEVEKRALLLRGYATARLLDLLETEERGPFPLSGTSLEVSLAEPIAPSAWLPESYEYRASDTIRGKQVPFRVAKAGFGAAVVATRLEQSQGGESDRLLVEIYHSRYPLTATLRFRAGQEADVLSALFQLHDTLRDDRMKVDGTEIRLATDFGAQFTALAQETDLAATNKALVLPGMVLSRSGLYLPESLDPDKIPVVFVHGVKASASKWLGVLNVLREDENLRNRYQFWVLNYPSGMPFVYASLLLRRSLDQALNELEWSPSDPSLQGAVIVGHSMGGLVAKLQITDTGSHLWDSMVGVAPEELGLDGAAASLAREAYFVDPLSYLERVVFLATPHRGVKLAGGRAGQVGSIVVRVPSELRAVIERIETAIADHPESKVPKRKPILDSIDALAPDNPALQALSDLPVAKGVEVHSIVGRDKRIWWKSTDIFVDYSSSHLDGVASELVVPYNHNLVRHPQTPAELLRILHEHLRARASATSGP